MASTVHKENIIRKLENGEPLFSRLPAPEEIVRPRIFGLESEVNDCMPGSDNEFDPEKGHGEFHFLGVNGHKWLPCGGKIYRDQPKNVLEICTPETSNPVEAVARLEGLRSYLAAEFKQHDEWKIYDMSSDWGGCNDAAYHSMGNHESYSSDKTKITCANDLDPLLPYLVARMIIAGSGFVTNDGFELSPRARFITLTKSLDTTGQRGLINTRTFETPDDEGVVRRLHFIFGDPNRNHIASFAKLTFMSLLIEMLEEGSLPLIPYKGDVIISDLKNVSKGSLEWLDKGVGSIESAWAMHSPHIGTLNALEIIKTAHDRATELFTGRDPVTDTGLIVIGYMLEKLEDPAKNMDCLARVTDWGAKFRAFFEFPKLESDSRRRHYDFLRSLDLDYHMFGEESFSRYLEMNSGASTLLPRKVIHSCIDYPPADTRASFRGWLVARLTDEKTSFSFLGTGQEHHRWDMCKIMDSRTHENEPLAIPNPFSPYHQYKSHLEQMIREEKSER